MEYTKEKIRGLRLRLGMTQTDLARRLNCESDLVASWELGTKFPEHHHLMFLDILCRHADSCSEELLNQPIVEVLFESTSEEQIILADVRVAKAASIIEPDKEI